VPVRITKRFTANLHFPQTGPSTFQLVPQTYRTPQGVCSPNDTNIIRYRWTISFNGNGRFNGPGFYYNTKVAEHTFTKPGNYVVQVRMESDDYCCVEFVYDTIHVAGATTSTSEIAKESFSLYPNPTKNLLYLQSSAEVNDIEMYDAIGRKVHMNYTPNGNEYRIELPELSKGVYFIHLITSHQQRFSQKVCIE